MKERKKPVAKENPIGLFAAAFSRGSADELLDQQEERGRKSFLASDTLPTRMDEEARKALEEAGVKFLEVVEDDPIFQFVELPTGWTRAKHPNPLWSRILDEQGRERALVFYKATFHDRHSYLKLPD